MEPLVFLLSWLRTGALPRTLDDDGDGLVEAAAAQGLAGLLHADASRQRVDWPAAVLQRLRRRQLADVCVGVQQLETAAAVQRRLLAEGLRSLPLKGAAVAETLYGPGERPMGDVDLLVLEDFKAALDLLARDGWRLEDTADHAVSLRSPQVPVVLELHRAAASCPGLHVHDAEGLWQRSREGRGQVPRLPAPEDLLVLLSIHAAFQHGLGLRLVQYLDVQRLVRSARIDADAALQVACRARAAGAVALTLEAAGLLLGPLPPAVEAAFAPHRRRELSGWLAARSRAPLALLSPTPRDVARVRWALARGRRVRFLRETLAGEGSRGWRARAARAWGLGRRLLSPGPEPMP